MLQISEPAATKLQVLGKYPDHPVDDVLQISEPAATKLQVLRKYPDHPGDDVQHLKEPAATGRGEPPDV